MQEEKAHHRSARPQRAHSEPLLGKACRNSSGHSSSSFTSSEDDSTSWFEEENVPTIRKPLEDVIPLALQRIYEKKDPQLLALLYDHVYHIPHLSFGYNEWFQTEDYEDYCTNVSKEILEKISEPMDREKFIHSAHMIIRTLRNVHFAACYEIVQGLFKLAPGDREEFTRAIVTITESLFQSDMSPVFVIGAMKLLPHEKEALFNNVRDCSKMFSSREMKTILLNPNFEQTHILLDSCKQWCEIIPDTLFLKNWLFSNWDQNIFLWLGTHERIKSLILPQSIKSRSNSLMEILDCLNHCTNTQWADRMIHLLEATHETESRSCMLAELHTHACLPTTTAPLFRRLIAVNHQLLEGVDDSHRRVKIVKNIIGGFNEVYTMAIKLNDLFQGKGKVTNAAKFLYIIGKIVDQNVYMGNLMFSILNEVVKDNCLEVLDCFYENASKEPPESLSARISACYLHLQQPSDSVEDEQESGEGD